MEVPNRVAEAVPPLPLKKRGAPNTPPAAATSTARVAMAGHRLLGRGRSGSGSLTMADAGLTLSTAPGARGQQRAAGLHGVLELRRAGIDPAPTEKGPSPLRLRIREVRHSVRPHALGEL